MLCKIGESQTLFDDIVADSVYCASNQNLVGWLPPLMVLLLRHQTFVLPFPKKWAAFSENWSLHGVGFRCIGLFAKTLPNRTTNSDEQSRTTTSRYAKDTALVPLGELKDVVAVTRLRCDAALYEVPDVPVKRGRGRPKKYGDKIDVQSMIASQEGWQFVEYQQYGQRSTSSSSCW